MHMEELSFPLVHAFQANTLTKRKLQDPSFTKITPLLRSHGLGPWVTKMILCLLDI